MSNTRIIAFSDLPNHDLIIDATYEGGIKGNAGDDPLSKLLTCENQGGFRSIGARNGLKTKYCVLYSDLSNIDWPDCLEMETGRFYYYGDNKEPGQELHATPKKGNEILRFSYDALHKGKRQDIPPFFVFTKGGKGRDVIFRGLAVPGAEDVNETEDLVAIWKQKQGNRFQNYRAIFTILDVATISNDWLKDIREGNPFSKNAPDAWLKWVQTGKYQPLTAKKDIEYRSKDEQLPTTSERKRIVQSIIDFFKNHPKKDYAFDEFAAKITRMMDNNIFEYDLTRQWRDGGRDAIGKYRIGMNDNAIYVDFALEAKCKQLSSGSGVLETSRLIARLHYRQFGIFVTTSFINKQAYEEIKTYGYPIIIISAEDITKILEGRGFRTVKDVEELLVTNFM